MKATSGLSWRSFLSKIHPPLPISSKDSARLLTLLTASFNQELDRRHPLSLSNDEHHSHLHLRSILTSPLLEGRKSTEPRRSNGEISGAVTGLLKRPMDLFIGQITSGTATLSSATLCLQAHYNNCLASPELDLSNSMRASGMGLTVVEWLWSSGLEESGGFLGNSDFIDLLLKFLVAESHHERIFQWQRRLHSDASEARSRKSRLEMDRKHTGFLMSYLSSEVSVGQGLESAMVYYTRMIQEVAKESTWKSSITWAPYAQGAYELIFKSMDTSDTAKIKPDTVRKFWAAVMSYYVAPNSSLAAFRDVYFAAEPSFESALKYFDELSPGVAKNITSRGRPYHILLGLRTAELCLDRGLDGKANAVMKTLAQSFSNEVRPHLTPSNDLGDSDPKKAKTRVGEELNIRILNTLVTA